MLRTLLAVILMLGVFLRTAILAAPSYFAMKAVDEQTGRGVPLVELETVNHVLYVTDSNGLVAFNEPGLMERDVFFFVRSHGYEFRKDGFGTAGVALAVKAGGQAEIKLKRVNIAERLYRVTGEGIYRDSVLLDVKSPIREPLLNAQVAGQDSVQSIVYRGKIYWFWGDTLRPRYPLGLFQMSGATSEMQGLDPGLGIDLHYFTGADGFSRAMAPLREQGPVWLDGLVTVPDDTGHERLAAHYSRMKDLGHRVEHGLMIYNDEKEVFEKIAELDLRENWRCPRGHPVRSEGYYYFPTPFCTVRVKATLADVKNPASYERVEAGAGPLTDIDSGKDVRIHAGSINWNAYRKKWILIGVQEGGTSYLGEVWYAEADKLTGAWSKTKKIVTHDRYSFYNPKHHPFLDQDGGRLIYFEGTYAETFSGNPKATPRYDYNQIMYRLDLSDPQLHGP